MSSWHTLSLRGFEGFSPKMLHSGPKFHLFPRDSGKDAGRGHIQNCPRAIDCEAVEARGQFWICPRTASFPDPEEKGGILTLLTSFPTLVAFQKHFRFKIPWHYGSTVFQNAPWSESETMALWEYCFSECPLFGNHGIMGVLFFRMPPVQKPWHYGSTVFHNAPCSETKQGAF